MTIFQNQVIDKKQVKRILSNTFNEFGLLKASYLAHELKDLGFHYATQAGLSVSIEDLRIPPMKGNLVKLATTRVDQAEIDLQAGLITEVERFQNVIYTWGNTSESLKNQVVQFFKTTDPLNSIYMMAFSGARGNISQVRQLVGMRGLMANPNGEIIDLPIIRNFREGLTITDYIISSYGARKGLVDTALRTADSGYLTRRLIDVAQDMITRERNCKTRAGILIVSLWNDDNEIKIPIHERVVGRLLASPVSDPQTGELFGNPDFEITPDFTTILQKRAIQKVHVRSPLTCGSIRAICQNCYGWNLAYGRLIDLGEAVGIIAAQSIGEPGTQLTMRTFHTGGVFNAELSRQVRAQLSGQVLYPKNMNPIQVRTSYGQVAYKSQTQSFLRIKDYKNIPTEVPVTQTTFILVEHKSFVKEDDILFEFPPTSKNSETLLKTIVFKQSGQVVIEAGDNQLPWFAYPNDLEKIANCFLWVLKGRVYTIPKKAAISFLNPYYFSNFSTVAISNFTCIHKGFAKIGIPQGILGKDGLEISDVEVFSEEQDLGSMYLYLEENDNNKNKRCVIYGSENWRFYLTGASNSYQLSKTVGFLVNLELQTPIGGHFYTTPLFRENSRSWPKYNLYQLKIGGTLFYIPELSYLVPYDEPIFLEPGQEVFLDEELYPGCFSPISGFFDIVDTEGDHKQLIVKPGQIIELSDESLSDTYNQTIFYPGELLSENILITNLSYGQVRVFKNKTYLYLSPIVRYEILSFAHARKPFTLDQTTSLNEKFLQLGKLERNFQKQMFSSGPVQIFHQPILFNKKENEKVKRKKLFFKYDFLRSRDASLKLKLVFCEKLSLAKYVYKEFGRVTSVSSLLVQQNQYVEPYTLISAFAVSSELISPIVKVTLQKTGNQRRLLVSQAIDFQPVFFEEPYRFPWKKTFLRKTDRFSLTYHYQNQGQVLPNGGNSIFLHLAAPYLVTQGGKMNRHPGQLVYKGENFAQLTYERAKTGDIVQGLPKIEEILEARKPKARSFISPWTGLVVRITSGWKPTYIWLANNQVSMMSIPENYRVLINKLDFIKVGQPLGDEGIYHQDLLEAYYEYYSTFQKIDSYKAAYRSFRKIQSVLIRAVQEIYESQGVTISDKHLEIIIKQMTTKVEIVESGESSLLPEEWVDLTQISFITRSLRNNNEFSFKPIILGITKASLKTNSFISAASFQYTTRILTEAAIHGKADWLRGLKENVIVGRLIPAGTGFHSYIDISYRLVRVPSSLTKIKSTPQPRVKYRQLQKHKFSFR